MKENKENRSNEDKSNESWSIEETLLPSKESIEFDDKIDEEIVEENEGEISMDDDTVKEKVEKVKHPKKSSRRSSRNSKDTADNESKNNEKKLSKKKPKETKSTKSSEKNSKNESSSKTVKSNKRTRSRDSESNVNDEESERKKAREDSVSNDDYDAEYFRRMSLRTQDKFHDPTDKELFFENIWKNINGKEISLSSHKHSSICISWFIESCHDLAILKQLCENLNVDNLTIDFLCSPNSSTILEMLIEILIKKLSIEANMESDTAKWIIKYLESVAKFVLDNLPKLINSVGNHIVITTIEAIGGVHIGRHWSRQNMRFGSGVKLNLQAEIEKDIAIKDYPQSFRHYLKKIAKVLVLDSNDEDIKNTLFGRSTAITQYLLFVLKIRYPELCQMVVKRLVEIIFSDDETRDFISQSASSAYIVEIIMLVSSESRLTKIWTKYLKGKLRALWSHDIANYIVQRLVDAIKDEKLLADVCHEIFPDLKDIFKSNRPGIGVCLSKACLEFKKMQPNYVTALMKAFDCYEPKEKQLDLVGMMIFIDTKDGFTSMPSHSKTPVWLHGSLMLQNILHYDEPYKIVKSLLSLPTDCIIRICKDRSGSHMIDSFIRSNSVSVKHKSELVERFLGHYYTLSIDKSGSRVVENILESSNNQVKNVIMNELSEQEAKLRSNRNGWFVANKSGLHHFKNRPNDWNEVERNRLKRRREFDGFINRPLGSSGGDRGDRNEMNSHSHNGFSRTNNQNGFSRGNRHNGFSRPNNGGFSRNNEHSGFSRSNNGFNNGGFGSRDNNQTGFSRGSRAGGRGAGHFQRGRRF